MRILLFFSRLWKIQAFPSKSALSRAAIPVLKIFEGSYCNSTLRDVALLIGEKFDFAGDYSSNKKKSIVLWLKNSLLWDRFLLQVMRRNLRKHWQLIIMLLVVCILLSVFIFPVGTVGLVLWGVNIKSAYWFQWIWSRLWEAKGKTDRKYWGFSEYRESQ